MAESHRYDCNVLALGLAFVIGLCISAFGISFPSTTWFEVMVPYGIASCVAVEAAARWLDKYRPLGDEDDD